MLKNIKWVMVGALIGLPIAGGIVAIKLGQFDAMGAAGANMTMPPEPVNAYTVEEAAWQPTLAAVGSVVPVFGTALAAETDGIVRSIHFEAGARVTAGQVLLQLDGELEQAQLREAKATVELARTSFQRATDLSKTSNISRSDLDAARTALQRAEAQVDYFQTLLTRKTLRAPFAGRMGIHRINVGQYLTKGTPVAGIQALDPVYVEFSLPQRHLGQIALGLTIRVSADAWPDQHFTGTVTAVNPDVDTTTRNIRVQATLANPDAHLRPGMYVGVQLVLDRVDTVLAIPATAVAHGPHGASVFVLKQKEGAAADSGWELEKQIVRLGTRRGDFVAVNEGVSVGDQVVSTGVFKLRPGMAVKVDNTLAPEFRLSPTPGNS